MKKYSFLTSLMALSVVFVAFLTYKDMLGYFFSNIDTTYVIFHWRIQSLNDIIRLVTERWSSVHFRPITALSGSIDYAIWGLNPFGYNLTNLVLHILVSVFLFLLMISLTKGELFTAWLSAIIFATHPVLANDVLVVPYRQDIIPPLFILISLFLFLKYISSEPSKKFYLFISLFFCALALGAKETAIICPFIIFSYMIIFSNEASHKERILKAFKASLPFFLITFIYFAWRTYLLYGLAGYGKYLKLSMWTNLSNIFSYLLDPVDLLHLGLKHIIILLLLILVFYRKEIKNSFTNSIHGKLVIFLLVWMLLPIGIFLLTLGYVDKRQAYIPTVPFSALLSVIFIKSLQATFTERGKGLIRLIKSAIASVLTLGLIVYFLMYSPLIKKYREVENCGKVCKAVLHQLLEMVPNLPEDTTIYINNLPNNIYTNGGTPIYDSSCFESGNYKHFLDIYYPGNRVKLIPHYTVWTMHTAHPLDVDSEIMFEIKKSNDENAIKMDIKITSDKITSH